MSGGCLLPSRWRGAADPAECNPTSLGRGLPQEGDQKTKVENVCGRRQGLDSQKVLFIPGMSPSSCLKMDHTKLLKLIFETVTLE